jgi:hypothetical protein
MDKVITFGGSASPTPDLSLIISTNKVILGFPSRASKYHALNYALLNAFDCDLINLHSSMANGLELNPTVVSMIPWKFAKTIDQGVYGDWAALMSLLHAIFGVSEYYLMSI